MRSLLVGRDHVGCLEHDPTKEAFISLTSKVISASALRQRHSDRSGFFHIPSDLVVDQWASDGESRANLDFLFLHDVSTTFGHLIGVNKAPCGRTLKHQPRYQG